jgi:hypothetical protein
VGVPNECFKEGHDCGPRLEVGHGLFGRLHQGVDVGAIDSLDDVDPFGEVAVERARPCRR